MYDHIVLISADTLRADAIAANPFRLWDHDHPGAVAPATPTLDELVGGGAFFPNTITAAPYTSAAHASVLTGRWPPSHGVYEFFHRPLTVPTVFAEARRHGFTTILKTDFPLMVGHHLGFDRDVDRYLVEDDDAYVEALRSSARSCSLLHFGSVHIPYGFHNLRYGGEGYRQRVDELERELGGNLPELPADQMTETPRSAEDLDLLLRYKRIVEELYFRRGDHDRLFELYLEGVGWFDSHRFATMLARVLDATAGRRRLVVLFGDHGEEYHDQAFGHFNSLDEGVVRVPLVLWGDDIEPRRVPDRVRTVDVVPTLVELQGWAPPGPVDGRSLTPALGGARPEPRRAHSQAFVSRARATMAAQRRALTTGEPPPALAHVLFRECVHDGDHRLMRRNHTVGTENQEPEPCAPVLELARFDEGLRPVPVDDPPVRDRLAGLLDDYAAPIDLDNRSVAPGGPGPAVPDDLRRQLQDQGYRV